MSDPSSPGAARHRPVAALLVVCGLVLLLTAALLVWQARAASDLAQDRELDSEAVAAARAQTMDWASVDFRDAEAYVETVKANATGDFLDKFEKTDETLVNLIVTNKSKQVPTVPPGGVGLIEREGDTARVVVALDATVTNISTPEPAPRQYRLMLTLHRVDGQWRTAQLELVP